MGFFDYVLSRLDGPIPKAWGAEFVGKQLSIDDAVRSVFLRTGGKSTYRVPSVREALGVPSFHGAVALIAGTTGMLSVQGYQNGALLGSTDTPRLIVRPDPYSTPQAFYSGTAADMAKRGEFVWWIASRDGSGYATALVRVPLLELTVEKNEADRLRPRYRWGDKIGTRWNPATRTGEFVHVMYPLGEPLALRGEGPLQMCGAAASVSVEAQAWAAQFYADGGHPAVIIKYAGDLSGMEDEEAVSEADALRSQWVDRPNNVPRIIDQNIESVDYKSPNESSSQMLQARHAQDGEAARMFNIPGSLLEYQSQGSSLTYQNLEGEFTKFVRKCLQPLYLEPIEQALSDLLPRAIVARFNVKGFLRADAKTRWEIYQIMVAVLGQERAAEIASVEEGLTPGDIEYAPVPFAPPAAVPARLSRGALRCDGTVSKVLGGSRREERCNRLLSPTGSFIGRCPRCKKDWPAAA